MSNAHAVKRRLPIVVSTTALVVAVFGSTPVGHAVGSAVSPFATHAKRADYATNAGAVNGIKASRQSRRLAVAARQGQVPGLGSGGRSGRAARAERRQGRTGSARISRSKGRDRAQRRDRAKGPQRPSGPGGSDRTSRPERDQRLAIPHGGMGIPAKKWKTWQVDCPSGKKALGGGVAVPYPNYFARVAQSAPAGAAATGWLATVANEYPDTTISSYVWVICAYVSA